MNKTRSPWLAFLDFAGNSPSFPAKCVRATSRFLPSGAPLPILSGYARGRRWISGAHVAACWFGTYELDKQELFVRQLKPGSSFLDIGAHAGFYSIIGSLVVGETGKVTALEPLSRNFSLLQKHVAINRLSNVDAKQFAAWRDDGWVNFEEGPTHAMGHVAGSQDGSIRAVSLDNAVARGEIPRPDFIKIDVEGGEQEVLTGARNILDNIRPTILLATHRPGWHPNPTDIHRICCEMLLEAGYRLQPIDSNDLSTASELLAVPEDRSDLP